jgi:hypothetical protein
LAGWLLDSRRIRPRQIGLVVVAAGPGVKSTNRAWRQCGFNAVHLLSVNLYAVSLGARFEISIGELVHLIVKLRA